jgi:integrase
MAKPYKEGQGWCVRQRYLGQDLYLSGLPTQAAAAKAARTAMTAIDQLGKARGLGPHRTTLAQALQDYAVEHLQRLKGASQEARRLNKYLLAAHLQLVEVSSAPAPSNMPFVVKLGSRGEDRRIPNGLGGHRKALLTKTAGSDELRRVLAQTTVADVSRSDVQRFMDALSRDGLSAASVGLERAVLRGFFNYARKKWKWSQPAENPAAGLTLPTVDNERKRVLSLAEQQLLDEAFNDTRNEQLKHVYVLLRETAMRASEPLLHATWDCVDWERSVLSLTDGKDGKREVPLSPVAVEALQALRPGKPGERIVAMTYEALKAGVRRACERAGVENLHIHDLRRTAATRMALDTGSAFMVKVLTGHKTLEMVQRYVNVTADDVVAVMRRKAHPASSLAGGESGSTGLATSETLTTQNVFTAEQVQAMVAKAVSDAMAAVAEARVPVPAPVQVLRPSTSSNVLQFRRAV